MASQAYRDWLAAGRPVSGLIRPMARLRDRLRAHGYTVYDVGNAEHMQHQPPEDHTPFSATGWPAVSPRWWLHAIDIMPPAAGRGLPSLQQLGAQMLADRKAGHEGMAWLKYMNWEPERNGGGACYQERFTPSYERRSSGDRGHIHQSGRTDMRDYGGADDYDPVARVRAGAGTPTEGAAAMSMSSSQQDTLYFTVVAAPNGPEHVRDALLMQEIQAVRAELATLAGRPVPSMPIALTDEQIQRLAALLAAADNELPADPTAIEAAVKRAVAEAAPEAVKAALREGTG